jgi:hypothetical protein
MKTGEWLESTARGVLETGVAVGGVTDYSGFHLLNSKETKHYYSIPERSALDFCHTEKVTLVGHVLPVLKKKRDPKPPIKPKAGVENYDEKLANYHLAVSKHAEIVKILKELGLSKKEQQESDLRYKFCYGPVGFVDINTLIFKHSGMITMHLAHVWWVTDLGKYTLYGICDPRFYEVISGVSDIFRTLTARPVLKSRLRAFRLKMVETMCRWDKLLPVSEHFILFHALHHIYQFLFFAGESEAYWMYVFERMNSLLKRLIRNRKDPEANIVNQMAMQAALRNLKELHGNRMRKSFDSKSGQKVFDFCSFPQEAAAAGDQPMAKAANPQMKLPKRFRSSRRYVKVVFPEQDHMIVFDLIAQRHGACSLTQAWEIKRSVIWGGVKRSSASVEPAFPTVWRRRSGFRIGENCVGQIVGIFGVNCRNSSESKQRCSVGIVKVEVFTAEYHQESALWVVDRENPDKTEWMLDSSITRSNAVVMIVPFVQKKWCVLDTSTDS